MEQPVFAPGVTSLILSMDFTPKPLWGTMTLQHMIEHLSLVTSMSNGKIKSAFYSKPEQIFQLISFLESDKPLPRHFKAPTLPPDRLPYLHCETLADALSELEAEIRDFEVYYKLHPDAKEMNPVFGELDERLWRRFHEKHFTHHLTQFGIISETSQSPP